MRWGRAVAVIGAAIALSGSEQITTILPGSLACGGAEAPICQSVARLAIAQMNLTATGPIEAVALESFDCVKGAESNFPQRVGDGDHVLERDGDRRSVAWLGCRGALARR